MRSRHPFSFVRSRSASLLLVVTVCLFLEPGNGAAQTSQRLSIQGSALFADIYGENFFAVGAGYGFELQLRYTPSALSFGGGIQFTHHEDVQATADGYEGRINLLGIFVEPRYTIFVGSEQVAPYLAGRIALARLDLRNVYSDGGELTWNSPGVTVNGGGGILVRLNERTNLDFGATAGFTNYQTAEGDDAGSTFEIDLGSGTNLVLRVGLAFGVGG